MTRSQGKSCRNWVIQVVHIEDPPVNSPAHLALLSKMYYYQDKTIYSECRMKNIRTKWFKQLMRECDKSKGLTCAICGRSGLLPHDKSPNYNNLATLDHIVEISRGGAWRDPSNFQVACYACNQRKNNQQPA